jgi:hypothetical protein
MPRVAEDRGGVLGADWLGIAAIVGFYTLPGIAIGVGLVALGRSFESRFRAKAKGGRSRPSHTRIDSGA